MVTKPGNRAKLDPLSSHPYAFGTMPQPASIRPAALVTPAAPVALCLLCTIIALYGPLRPPVTVAAELVTAQVKRVIDGDTIILANGDRVRYIGMDTPEMRYRQGGHWVSAPQPFAVEATAENRRLLRGGTVRLEMDQQRKDRYGRRLAYVYVKDQMINEQLVLQGLAKAKAYPPNLRHQDRLRAAERAALKAKRGLWATRDD